MSEAKARSPWLAAVAGGAIGSALMAGFLILAAPQLIGPKIVRDGLLAEPELLVEASQALQNKQYEPVLTAYRKALETPYGSSWKGAEKPDVVLVEFFDYACSYCRASNADVDRLLAEDKGLRVVYREFPILGQDSMNAARLSMVASRVGKFRQFYDAQFAAGRPDGNSIAQAARTAGLPSTIGTDPAGEAELKRNYQLAQQLQVNGTPLFIVGNKVLNGAVGFDALKKAVADTRAARS